MNRGMLALIRKDLRSVTANHRMLVTLLVVPLVLTVFLPTVAVVTLHTAPEEAADFQKLLALLPVAAGGEGQERQILNLLLNYVLPLFFLIIPVMTASVMASASLWGSGRSTPWRPCSTAPCPSGRCSGPRCWPPSP